MAAEMVLPKVSSEQNEKMSEKSINQDKYWDDISDEEQVDNNINKRKRGRQAIICNGEENKNRRLELNRLSAKESRKRKKMYMSNLEEKNYILEKEKARLLRKINTLEDRIKMNNLTHVDTTEQMIEGRQHLYDRLEECLEIGGD